MSFKFSLQKILILRENEANDAQKKLLEIENILFQLKNILNEERIQYFSDRDELNEAVKKVEFPKIKLYETSLSIRQEKMMDLLKNIREVTTDLNDQKNILQQAKINFKMIEKLYEIKEKEYEKKELQKEQIQLDELAALGFRKNLMEDENEEE